MYVVICKIDHCIHIHWCIPMGVGHNDPWVESHMWPQQTWGQMSSRGQWPLVQVFGKRVSVSTYFDVFSNLILQWLHKYVIAKAGETRGSRTALLQCKITYHLDLASWWMNRKLLYKIFKRIHTLPVLITEIRHGAAHCSKESRSSLVPYSLPPSYQSILRDRTRLPTTWLGTTLGEKVIIFSAKADRVFQPFFCDVAFLCFRLNFMRHICV